MRRIHQPQRPILIATTMLVLAVAIVGCNAGPDQRVAEMAERNLAEQSRQNERLANQSQRLIEASQQLVAADAQSRQQMLAAHAMLQQEIRDSQASIEQQRDSLEQERRDIALQRHRDPIVAEAMNLLGMTLACGLPLLLAGYVIYVVNHSQAENADVSELLVTQFVAQEPLQLPTARSAPRLRNQALDSEPDSRVPTDT